MTSIESDPTAESASAIDARSDDRFLWGFPLSALCCVIILAALVYVERISGGSLVLAAFLFVLVLVATLVIAFVGIVALVKGRFKRAAALLLAPFIIASPFLFPTPPYEDVAFDLMRFYLTRAKYDEVIDRLSPTERASRILFFDWGKVGLAVTSTTVYWLVYDESEEIARPVEERSQSWKDRAARERLYFSDEKCLAEARRLTGHYYSAFMSCPY
jgi:hypothetical protein